MKRFSSRDALLMLAPVALLGAFGWMLSKRKPALVSISGPFQPFISRVRVLPATPLDVFDGYDTRVIVEFDAHGRLPAWWQKGFSGYSSTGGGQLLRVKGHNAVLLGHRGYCDSPHLDSNSKLWTSEYRLKLRAIAPGKGQIRLRDAIEFKDNHNTSLAKLWLDTPVRADGVTTKLLVVPHTPCVKLEHFSLDSTPPLEWHDNIQRWRVKWTFFKNIPRAGAETDQNGINMRIAVVNRKGERVGSVSQTSYMTADEDEYTYSLNSNATKPTPDPRQQVVREDYRMDLGSVPVAPSEPLWLQGSVRSGEQWPLAIRVPLRDNTGRVLLSPRTPVVPFRVVSISNVAPRADEMADSGADCVVSVALQAWNTSADLRTWKWEANYSQQLRTANGKTLWELPFKRGKQVIGLSYGWSQDHSRIELRYPLVLKSIPAKAGKIVFHADIATNGSRRVPIEFTVRP